MAHLRRHHPAEEETEEDVVAHFLRELVAHGPEDRAVVPEDVAVRRDQLFKVFACLSSGFGGGDYQPRAFQDSPLLNGKSGQGTVLGHDVAARIW